MPINKWFHKLDLTDVFHNDDLTFEQKRNEIAHRIRTSRFFAADELYLTEIYQRIEDAEDTDEFDDVWEEFYDYADRERIWVATDLMAGESILDLTNAQAYGRDAARGVGVIATKLEELAADLRLVAQQMERGDGTASRTAADVVNECTQRVGSAGGHLWSVVRNAADADREYLKEQQ